MGSNSGCLGRRHTALLWNWCTKLSRSNACISKRSGLSERCLSLIDWCFTWLNLEYIFYHIIIVFELHALLTTGRPGWWFGVMRISQRLITLCLGQLQVRDAVWLALLLDMLFLVLNEHTIPVNVVLARQNELLLSLPSRRSARFFICYLEAITL